jgi:hypothetical protein
MRILVIGSSAIELERTCCLTLRKFRNDGNEICLLIVEDASERRLDGDQGAKARLEKLGFRNVHVIEDFDFSEINQHNAKNLNNYIKSIDPSLLFMPFWKSSEEKNRILSRTALIACRGLGNVLMYDERCSPGFAPNISFVAGPRRISCFLNTTGGSTEISNEHVSFLDEGSPSNHHSKDPDLGNLNNDNESFEVHRMVMLDGGLL